jgi:hypothetical protein
MEPLPPFLFAAKANNQPERRRLARLRAEGRISAIGPRLFTSLPEDQVPAALRGAWPQIVTTLFPNALVSHRTALAYTPSPDGEVFLTGTTNRSIAYPGVTLVFTRGPGPLADDIQFIHARASSVPRAFLENLMHDKRVSPHRSLPVAEVERRLEVILRDGGEEALNKIRDRAREIAVQLAWNGPFERLHRIIAALLGSRPASGGTSDVARARNAGAPFDPACMERLQTLFGELRTRAIPTLPDLAAKPPHDENKAFFEAYFSNFIEGTQFEIEEAEEIVFDKKIPANRPKDAHDIVGTYAVVADPTEMRRVPASSEELLELLRRRHKTVLDRRPEVRPGELKVLPNRAGDTQFVVPELVIGTLKRGHELYLGLEPGFQRAVFMMFLVSDVHPFADGNGRVARIMMNAELVAADAATIIIPTVFRDEHLQALRALTRRRRPAVLVDALAKAARFSRMDFSSYPAVLADLQRRNWFRDPDDARILMDP